VYQNLSVASFGANFSLVLPVVKKAEDSGADMVISYMGVTGPFIQAVAQEGKKVKAMVLTGYGPGLIEQLGDAVNDVYVTANAAAYLTQSSPGIAQFKKDMKAAGVNDTPLYYNELGYIIATQFVNGLQKAGKNPTKASLLAALNGVKNDTLGGLVPPLTYPDMRFSSSPCGVVTQVQNGKFVQVGQKPFQCGKVLGG
jgi:ABC-type branched-subunit amino acid transport system substrate-binding protein